MPRLRSLNTLIIAGFALVGLPLIVTIIVTTTFVNRLTQQSEMVVEKSTYAARSAQMISGQVIALERNARQYKILGDTDLLALYEQRHAQLMGLIKQLRTVTLHDAALESRLNRLSTQARAMLARLRAPQQATAPRQPSDPASINENPTQARPESLRFDTLNTLTTDVVASVNAWIDQQLQKLRINARDIDQLLFWQAAAVIPLVVLFAILFTFLINRPVHELGLAIKQLGKGGFQKAIYIRGPLDLASLGEQLEWLRLRLVELEQEKNKFLSNMSHELKTPLANVREGAELLSDGSVGDLSPAQREVANIMLNNSLALQYQIEDLLQFNTWRGQQTNLTLESCNISTHINHVLANHRLRLASDKIKIALELNTKHVTADAEQLTIMLDNLVSNAIKYSPLSGVITVRSSHDNGWVKLEVADEGPGIAPQEETRIFEAFYQGRRAGRGHLRGTGIGLAIVQESARAHGGDISIRQGQSPGAHFLICLPDNKQVITKRSTKAS